MYHGLVHYRALTTVVLFGPVTVPRRYPINYRLQNRAVRFLTQSSYDADTNQLIFKKVGLGCREST